MPWARKPNRGATWWRRRRYGPERSPRAARDLDPCKGLGAALEAGDGDPVVQQRILVAHLIRCARCRAGLDDVAWLERAADLLGPGLPGRGAFGDPNGTDRDARRTARTVRPFRIARSFGDASDEVIPRVHDPRAPRPHLALVHAFRLLRIVALCALHRRLTIGLGAFLLGSILVSQGLGRLGLDRRDGPERHGVPIRGERHARAPQHAPTTTTTPEGTHEPIGRAAMARPDRDTLDRVELDARLVLRVADLDLAGVRVSRMHDRVRVEGSRSGATRHRRAVSQLAALPHVEVHVAPSTSGGTGTTGTRASPPPRGALARWLTRTFGTSPERTTFVPALVARVHSVHQRVRTLDHLAQRYSETEAAALSSASHVKLSRLIGLHYQALRADLDGLNARLAVLFGSKTRLPPGRRTPADWQRRTTVVLGHTDRLAQAVDAMLMLDDLPSDFRVKGSSEVHRVSVLFDTLWDAVNDPTQLSGTSR